ncbi:Uncharacterised protein [uncultured archaeon]|nr:Uncharacterised protein [uncultured archaeon]
MDRTGYLKIMLALSVFGMLFSGYLSYGELTKTCTLGCSAAGTIFGLPPCLYGLAMYTIITILAVLALKEKK